MASNDLSRFEDSEDEEDFNPAPADNSDDEDAGQGDDDAQDNSPARHGGRDGTKYDDYIFQSNSRTDIDETDEETGRGGDDDEEEDEEEEEEDDDEDDVQQVGNWCFLVTGNAPVM